MLAVARRVDRLQELAARSAAAGHAAIHAMGLDVTAAHAAVELLARARELGGAGWLVNCAGNGRLVPFIDDVEAQAPQVRLNCEALVAITAAFVRDLVARKAGVILNVASSAGFQPTPGMTTYGACKAFVISFSEGLAEELRGTGVTVTALCPGPVDRVLRRLRQRRRAHAVVCGDQRRGVRALRHRGGGARSRARGAGVVDQAHRCERALRAARVGAPHLRARDAAAIGLRPSLIYGGVDRLR